MGFTTEVDLVNTLKKVLKETYENKIEIFEEVSVGFGIADLVVTNFKSQEIDNDIVLDLNDVSIYCCIKSSMKGTLLEELTNTTKISNAKTKVSINKLMSLGYLMISETEHYKIKKDYTFSSSKNYAIEAKLKDWKRALNQAFRYKWFAEYSFVVLDEQYSKPAIKSIDQFKKYNVGLVTISNQGKLVKYYAPKNTSPFDERMRMLFSEKIKN